MLAFGCAPNLISEVSYRGSFSFGLASYHYCKNRKDDVMLWQSWNQFSVYTLNEEPILLLTEVLSFNVNFCRLRSDCTGTELKFGNQYLLKITSSDISPEFWVVGLLSRLQISKQETICDFSYLSISNERLKSDPWIGDKDTVTLISGGINPEAWALHPWYLSQNLTFEVLGFQKKYLRLRHLLKDYNYVLPGMKLSLKLSFPHIGFSHVTGTVRAIEFEKGEQRVLFNIETRDKKYSIDLSQYLARYFLGGSRDIYKKLELPQPEYRGNADIGFAIEENERISCLELRLNAYKKRPSSKLNSNLNIQDIEDQFDSHSSLMRVKLEGRIVATGRLLFNNGMKQLSEVAQLTDLPAYFWNKGFLEASRFATDSNHRGSDLFLLMLYLSFKTAFNSGLKYIVVECESSLSPKYKKFGAYSLNKTVLHPMENISLDILYFNVDDLIRGKNINFFIWLFYATPLLNHLITTGTLKLSLFRRMMIRIGVMIPMTKKNALMQKINFKKIKV